jgi:hypothetical protein
MEATWWHTDIGQEPVLVNRSLSGKLLGIQLRNLKSKVSRDSLKKWYSQNYIIM